jgi:2-dehydropantoate 2-reductase
MISGIFGSRRVKPSQLRLASSISELTPGHYDLILLCVKSYDTEASIQALNQLLSERTVVVSMQNGYGNVERLTSNFGKDRVLAARVITGFSMPQAGNVEITVHADDILVGSFYVSEHPIAKILAQALNKAGLPTRSSPNIQAALWAKILYNCALNPLGAILGVNYGALGDSPEARALMDNIIDEAFAVIHRYSFPCLWDSPESFRRAFYGSQIPATYAHKPSMLQDLESGKRTEIDALNGALVHLAAKKDILAPVNKTMVRMVHFLEHAGS